MREPIWSASAPGSSDLGLTLDEPSKCDPRDKNAALRRPARVAVVVLNWNGAADTIACLESLEQVSFPSFRVIVVDNGSSDGLLDLIRQRRWRIDLESIQLGVNLGYAGGNNAGIQRAVESGSEFVLILNNDTTVAPDVLKHLVDAAEASPAHEVLGPCILYSEHPETIWFAGGIWNRTTLRFEYLGQDQPVATLDSLPDVCDYVCGAAMFLRTSVVERIGVFDKRFFLVYEESDWCFRARRVGIICRIVPEARVWHKIGASFGSEASPLRRYFSARNELLWAEKNLSFNDWCSMVRRSMKRLTPALSFGVKGGEGAIRRILWGLAQFWRGLVRSWYDPCHIAFRLGMRDYALRRFGICPPGVWALQREWQQRESEFLER